MLTKRYRTSNWVPHIEEQICAKRVAEKVRRLAEQALLHRYQHFRRDNKALTVLISLRIKEFKSDHKEKVFS